MDCEFEAGMNRSGDGPAEAELDHFLDHLDEIDRDQRYFERYGTEHRHASPMEPGELAAPLVFELGNIRRSEEHTSELQSLKRISYAVFCLNKKRKRLTLTTAHDQSDTHPQYQTSIRTAIASAHHTVQ